jgi:phosphohistidine phosphatase SixA
MSPSGNAAALVDSLMAEGRKRAMLVGHEPDLGDLMTTLLEDGSFRRGFEKAMVVGLQVAVPATRQGKPSAEAGRRTRLRFVLDPKALRLDPDLRALT